MMGIEIATKSDLKAANQAMENGLDYLHEKIDALQEATLNQNRLTLELWGFTRRAAWTIITLQILLYFIS